MHGGHSVEYDQICRAAHEAGALVALRPLSVADRRKYTCACFGVTDVPEPVFQMISRMAAGNPLHTELLAEEMMRSGLVRIEEGAIVEHAETFDAMEVPERITGALLGLYDQMHPRHQEILKVASILPEIFSLGQLRHVLLGDAGTQESSSLWSSALGSAGNRFEAGLGQFGLGFLEQAVEELVDFDVFAYAVPSHGSDEVKATEDAVGNIVLSRRRASLLKPRLKPVAKRAGLANDNLLTFCSMLLRKLAREMLTSEREAQLIEHHTGRSGRTTDHDDDLDTDDNLLVEAVAVSPALQSGPPLAHAEDVDGTEHAMKHRAGSIDGEEDLHELEREHDDILNVNDTADWTLLGDSDPRYVMNQGRMFLAACAASEGIALARMILSAQKQSTDALPSADGAPEDRARAMLAKAIDFIDARCV